MPSSPQAQLAVASPVSRRAQERAVGREDVHAAGAGGEQVAVLVDLHAVGQALLAALTQAVASKNTRPLPERAVGLAPRRPSRSAASGSDWATYSVFSSGEKAMPLGRVISLVSSVTLPSVRDAIHAAEIELAARIVEVLRQAVGRIGEVQIAVGFEHGVVGAVEPLALVAVDQRLLAAVWSPAARRAGRRARRRPAGLADRPSGRCCPARGRSRPRRCSRQGFRQSSTPFSPSTSSPSCAGCRRTAGSRRP